MKLTGADFPRLQLSVLAALVMIAVGAASVVFALNALKAARVGRAAAQSDAREFDNKFRRVRSEENEIREKSAIFAALQKRGIVGEEKRLEWVELIKEIRDKRRLIDLHYEIAPQRALDPAPASATGAASATSSFAFYSSSMRLQLKLLHEEDLVRLLGDLRRQATALIQVKACSVARLPSGAGESWEHGQLQADCQIDWTTVREVAVKTGSSQ